MEERRGYNKRITARDKDKTSRTSASPLNTASFSRNNGGGDGYGSINEGNINDDDGPSVQLLSGQSHSQREQYHSQQRKPHGIASSLDIKLSPDEFEEQTNINDITGKITRTGRQRKKLAARTKGGEFQTKRKKKRIYFCCISSEIDLEKLQEAILAKPLEATKHYESKMFEDVLHIFISDNDSPATGSEFVKQESFDSITSPISRADQGVLRRTTSADVPDVNPIDMIQSQSALKLWTGAARELFVFEFGVAVFWGFSRAEEEEMISLIRNYVEQGMLTPEECTLGQDDMAFIISNEVDQMEVSNDVITLPDDFGAKYRLSASFAIAQSAVLNVFEARIEARVKEYKYIPESLAHSGRLTLAPKMLNRMIGDVYKIRHDVNLHTEILDTPDFFWKQEKLCDDIYKLISRYLEMSERTQVLNKRLDMLRELLSVLQQQQENASATKLEWIVIWLIVMSVVVEVAAIAVEIYKT